MKMSYKCLFHPPKYVTIEFEEVFFQLLYFSYLSNNYVSEKNASEWTLLIKLFKKVDLKTPAYLWIMRNCTNFLANNKPPSSTITHRKNLEIKN